MELVNTINSKELYANRAVNDKNGKQIDTTYATNDELHDVNDIQFTTGQNISEVIIDAFAKVTPPYSMSFISESAGTTGTLINIPADQKAGFIIKATCLWDMTKTGTAQSPNYARSVILELTNASSSSEKDPTFKYVARIANGTTTKPSTYPVPAWQKIKEGGGSGGKTYTGVDPIIVDNTANTISADTVELECKDVTYQQITHDDSLVHVSNDAQYALGVNTRMFKDETVLWEGSAETNITLSESVNNFERIIIIGQQRDIVSRGTSTEIDTLSTTNHVFSLRMMNLATNGNFYDFFGCYDIDSTGKTITLTAGGYNRWSNQTATSLAISFTSTTNPFYIRKVLGVGRKGGN